MEEEDKHNRTKMRGGIEQHRTRGDCLEVYGGMFVGNVRLFTDLYRVLPTITDVRGPNKRDHPIAFPRRDQACAIVPSEKCLWHVRR